MLDTGAGHTMSAFNYNDHYERGGWNRDKNYHVRYFRSLSKVHALPADSPAAKSALDLGCGRGDFSEGLASIGYGDVVGIDLSSRAIELCEKSPSRGTNNHYIQADFFQHDFGGRTFDFILAIGFSPFNTSNFGQVDRTLQRLRCLVHPSGSVTILVPSSGRSGGSSWYSWNAGEIEYVRQLALRYYEVIEMHFFISVSRPRWPVLTYNRFSNHLIRFLCWATGKRVELCIVLRSPKLTTPGGL